jgi:hypothetical protein
MAWFNKTKPNIRNSGDGKITRLPRGYEMAWERQSLPDPAAMNYSWETLGLVQFSPIGPSVAVRKPFSTLFPQLFSGFSVWLAGIPLTQGQVIGQPLYDPRSGFTRSIPMQIPSLVDMNIPVSINHPIGFNDPNPIRARP